MLAARERLAQTAAGNYRRRRFSPAANTFAARLPGSGCLEGSSTSPRAMAAALWISIAVAGAFAAGATRCEKSTTAAFGCLRALRRFCLAAPGLRLMPVSIAADRLGARVTTTRDAAVDRPCFAVGFCCRAADAGGRPGPRLRPKKCAKECEEVIFALILPRPARVTQA